MKLFHLSDLHLGKQFYRYDLKEQQDVMLEDIRQAARSERPDAVLIAGDLYDRSVPPVQAAQSLEAFLTGLNALEIPVCIVSGNHDSAERLAFLSAPLRKSGLYISPAYHGQVDPISLNVPGEAPVDVWLLPFVKAATVRPWFPQECIETTQDAVVCAIRHMAINPSRRNILVAHQFVAGGQTGGSEDCCAYGDIAVGGLDLVDARVFAPFDYVALGHLHRGQNVGGGRIRYCGSPLPYSYEEAREEKGITVVTLSEDRAVDIRLLPLTSSRRMQEIRGTMAEVTAMAAALDRDAFTHVTLTDTVPVPDGMSLLRQYYPYLTHVDRDMPRAQAAEALPDATAQRGPMALFDAFYSQQAGQAMTEEQRTYLSRRIHEIWEAEA